MEHRKIVCIVEMNPRLPKSCISGQWGAQTGTTKKKKIQQYTLVFEGPGDLQQLSPKFPIILLYATPSPR